MEEEAHVKPSLFSAPGIAHFAARRPWAVALLLFLTCASQARADYVSYTMALDQSNVMPDGVKYGSVVVEAYDGVGAPGGGLSAGSVRLTFTADVLPVYGKLSNFGIDKVGFNTDLDLSKGQIQ